MALYLWLLADKALAVGALPVDTTQPSATATDLPGNAISIGNGALSILLLVIGVATVFYVIWAGLQYVTSAGNPEKAKAGRTGVLNAIIGIVVIVCAYGAVRFAISVAQRIHLY